MKVANVVSVSGGKDSTATLLLTIERGEENVKAVFADTGNEHEITYEYISYLEEKVGIKIERVRPDFSERIAKKRIYVEEKWPLKGVPDEVVRSALDALHPTGNPFLDLCIWKGRFPSTKARFCTDELKVNPINNQFMNPLIESMEYGRILSWQGVRAQESPSRAKLPMMDMEFGDPETGSGLWNYRPILQWSVEEVFDFHRKHGIKWNPLYEKGMGRVGCMPCVNCRKGELKEIARQFPEVIERIALWEEAVSKASKRQLGTFFPSVSDPTAKNDIDISHKTHGIDRAVEWSNTTRGGETV